MCPTCVGGSFYPLCTYFLTIRKAIVGTFNLLLSSFFFFGEIGPLHGVAFHKSWSGSVRVLSFSLLLTSFSWWLPRCLRSRRLPLRDLACIFKDCKMDEEMYLKLVHGGRKSVKLLSGIASDKTDATVHCASHQVLFALSL